MHPSEMESAANVEVRQSEQTSHRVRHARFGAFGALAAVCVVVALFAVLMHRPDGGIFGAPPNTPADWQTYSDPRGLFSVRMPAQWAASVETSTDTFGDRTGSATETEELIRLSDPALGEASARVSVLVAPIHGDFERHWYCQSFPQKNDSFHGIPAQNMSPATWLFDTASAHFQIDIWIPRVLEPPHSSPVFLTPAPTPTPLPQQTVAADQAMLTTILNAFQPANTTALSCP